MIRLFVNTYNAVDLKRDIELAESFGRNFLARYIDQIFEINELGINNFPVYAEGKVLVFKMLRQPTYSDFINLANAVSDSGDICIIANSDIYFDDTIEKAKGIGENEVYALSRIDVTDKGNKPFFRPDSQDAWIFRAPMVPIQANFTLGVPGCDNRIARIFADAGYKVTNPCHSINAFHLHQSQVRNYNRSTPTVKGEYLLLPPTKL